MANSFQQSVNSLMTSSNTTENTVNATALLADEVVEENFTRDNTGRYKWYDEYIDNSYSKVDSQKNIAFDQSQINITQETRAQVIPFELDRYWDNVDLSNMLFKIHYVNPNNHDYNSTPINVSYSENKIRFYWLIDEFATAVTGFVDFEIIATGTISTGEKYIWKTKPNKKQLNVLLSLSGDKPTEINDDWYTQFVVEMDEKVSLAQEAATEAREIKRDLDNQLDALNTKVDTIQDDVKQAVIEEILTDTLSNYYTKEEVEAIIANIDYSELLDEINNKIDAIDGLAALRITYDSSTNTMSFYNGKTLISSHVLNTNPTAEWTSSFKQSMQEEIAAVTNPISEALDAYKTENDSKVSTISDNLSTLSTNVEQKYATKEEVEGKLEAKADKTEVSALSTSLNKVADTADTNKTNISAVTTKVAELEEAVNNIDPSPSMEYDVDYAADTGTFSFYEDGSIKKSFIIQGGGGGGGSTSTTVTVDRITQSPLTIVKGDKAVIKYNFSSVDSSGDDTGEGSATWKVGSNIVATSIVLQGENSFDLTDYVTVGTQKITLTVTDAAGTITVKTWTVQVVDVRLESSFNDTFAYPMEAVSFDYTPYGAIEKTVHFILDGIELGTVTTSVSGLPMSYTIPAQTHGAHLLECYITANVNNTEIETEHILKDIIWYDEESGLPVIGCIYQNITAKQYDNTNIIYTVYDPATENPKVTLSVDDNVVSTLTLDSATQTWQYKSSDIGEHTLTIACKSVVKTIHVTVEKLDINVEPVTANLAFDFNPSGRSNNDEDRLWTDDKTSVAMTVSDNFDWVNGGYHLDENGDQYFCVKAGTSATIDYNLFADDARKNGKEFKIIFKTENVRKSNAKFLRCTANSIGLEMNVHEAYVHSSADSLYVPYSEEDIIELDINIFKDTEIPLVLSYEDGSPGRPMIYTSDHSFTQSDAVPIVIGSADCDVLIYRMKAYSSSLSDSGILSNFIADARNATEMIARYNRNQIYDENNQLTPESVANACPKLKVIKIECPHFTNDKKDFVKNTTIECIHKGGDPILDNWKAVNCYHSGQGTTSNEYGYAGRNMDLLMCFDGNYTNSKIVYDENYKTILTMGDGSITDDGTGKITLTRNSVPTNYLNIKVNIASSENENNALLQKRFNDYLPYTSVAKKKNSNVKNTMEFVNCVVFIKENDEDLSTHREFQDTDWHFYAIGNVGDSKKTDYTRVADPTDPKEFVVEIMDNTLPNSTFSGTGEALAALDADTFNEKGTYGFRYEMSGITDEQHNANIQTWRDFYRFVALSTGEEFKAGLKNWFIVDSALYMYLFTERYTMIDNRAKNTFYHWSKVYISQEEAEALGEDAKYYTIDDEMASVNNGYRFDFWDYDNDKIMSL